MVYVAVTVFVLGMVYRVYQWVRAPKTRIKTGIFPKESTAGARWLHVVKDSFVFPQVLEVDRWMWFFTILFHFGLLGAFVGHLRLVHELTPLANLLGGKGMDQLSLLGGGVMGIILIVTLAYYLLRRFTSPFKEMSVLEDYLLLILLILIVVMGNHMRFVGHVHTSDYRAYVQSLLVLKPAFPAALADSATKSALVLRDLDILQSMAKRGLVKVALSVTTLDRKLARAMEPRAATPEKRLETVEKLASAGVPAAVMVAPVIPGLTDSEMERILERASVAGAAEAGYILLRLPLEIGDLFVEWLKANCPDRAERVLSLMRQSRGGKLYEAKFGDRMEGHGPYAWMIGRRFQMAAQRLGLNGSVPLRTDLFTPPKRPGQQLRLL